MKIIMLFSIAGLLVVGCQYESPFTTEHRIAIDSDILGLWEPKAEDGKEPKENERLMILKYSDTEYLIHYPIGEDGIYYRGYPIMIGGITCVRLQIIGIQDGPPKKDETDLFYAVSYQLTDHGLEIKTLNTDLVDDELKSTEELHAAFLKHKENKDLFKDPGMFRSKEKAEKPASGDGV